MITCDAGRCKVDGPVTMRNVTGLLAESARLFAVTDVVVDLAGVTEVDSAAVSLLLEWRRAAQAAARRVEFINVPANLKSLADLYGVSELLTAGSGAP
ncbi:MAG: STAS domain-containing protein [Burkholderiales bacterium]